MSQAMRSEEILRKLAVVDERFAGDWAGIVLGAPAVWGLDSRTAAP